MGFGWRWTIETVTVAARVVRAPRGSALHCLGWPQEAAFRMIQNNLDPDVAERPEELIVYGGTGRAARSWPAFDRILATLARLKHDETGYGISLIFRPFRVTSVRAASMKIAHWCSRG